jgi:hypothetical protein
VIVAATFMAAVGDIRRFPDRRKLTAYERTVKDWQQNKGASATPGRASHGSPKEHVARQTSRPTSAL